MQTGGHGPLRFRGSCSALAADGFGSDLDQYHADWSKGHRTARRHEGLRLFRMLYRCVLCRAKPVIGVDSTWRLAMEHAWHDDVQSVWLRRHGYLGGLL